jgi:hypothetical protein
MARDQERVAEALALRESGKTLVQIGAAMGLSRERARQLSMYGVKQRVGRFMPWPEYMALLDAACEAGQ